MSITFSNMHIQFLFYRKFNRNKKACLSSPMFDSFARHTCPKSFVCSNLVVFGPQNLFNLWRSVSVQPHHVHSTWHSPRKGSSIQGLYYKPIWYMVTISHLPLPWCIRSEWWGVLFPTIAIHHQCLSWEPGERTLIEKTQTPFKTTVIWVPGM